MEGGGWEVREAWFVRLPPHHDQSSIYNLFTSVPPGFIT